MNKTIKIMMVLCMLSLALSLSKDLVWEKADSISFLSGMLTGFLLVMIVSFITKKIIEKVKNKNKV